MEADNESLPFRKAKESKTVKVGEDMEDKGWPMMDAHNSIESNDSNSKEKEIEHRFNEKGHLSSEREDKAFTIPSILMKYPHAFINKEEGYPGEKEFLKEDFERFLKDGSSISPKDERDYGKPIVENKVRGSRSSFR